jgi:serine protease Do
MSEAQKITVSLFDREETYDAKIIGTDAQTDLAIIKIDAENLTPAELGDSDSVKVGEFAMAIGNPLGLDSSVTCGIVSAVNRKVSDDEGNTYSAIQTDASINSGNSGGALVNSEGKVIGINTLKLSGTGVEGIGFAIPINSTIDIYTQLIKYNKVIRPYIGISGRNVTEELATKHKLVVGIYITGIEQFSAAELAGLKIGDVITAADGTSVKTMDDLNNIKNTHKVGDKMTLTVYRNGENIDLTLTLKEQ